MKALKNNRGQVLIEAILLGVIFASFWLAITNYSKNTNMMKKIVEDGFWPKLSGMIESGVWRNAQQAKKLHPNNLDRSVSKQDRGR